MIDSENAILVAVDSAGGVGRTALQKIIFFAKEAGLVEVAYEPHYYGPYSREVADMLMRLVAVGWVEELAESWPDGSVFGERRRYTYQTTTAGKEALKKLVNGDATGEKLRNIVGYCKEKTGLDFEMLSWAAKIQFMLTKAGRALTPEDIEKYALEWGWQVKKENVPKVRGLLEALNMARKAA